MPAIGAALQCEDEAAIAEALLRLHGDSGFRNALVAKARAFVEQNQGATARIADLLAESL